MSGKHFVENMGFRKQLLSYSESDCSGTCAYISVMDDALFNLWKPSACLPRVKNSYFISLLLPLIDSNWRGFRFIYRLMLCIFYCWCLCSSAAVK